jgi:hypothetical protein
MKKRAIEVRPTESFPEVIEFLEAKAALEEFKQVHPEVFEELSQLTERYNATLEQAEKVVRQSESKCGPFDAYQVSVKYNAEALYNAVGRDAFLQIGGTINQTTEYELDKGRFEAAVSSPSNKITEEVLKTVRKETVTYHVPTKLVVP